ncbi:DUF4893 domain-containing protein [Caulobacter endophyticus]|uniref:DUF4893 domain-containing protein n=1 Tax=Caulobacter endophyticus TaxID=2172652 RepID=UPI00240F89A6|nr:DUF4893 domain-containing protein [Caulobacter endophyticus]MDG2527702.1 DUF4893 domain-containing protein [Caulobacter endophyticus]
MRAVAAFALSFLAVTPVLAASGDWRRDATREDMQRIERLNSAWEGALSEARRGGHARDLRALGALVEPRAALPRPQPTPGNYQCRTIKLGSPGGRGLPYVAYGWFRCRVELTPGGDLVLEKTTGSQRQAGNLYPDSDRRLVFLGAVAWGDREGRATYRRDPERDQAGVFERIGPNRYRLVMPWPKQESKLDILELKR